MGQSHSELSEKQINFINEQKVFFVATAGKEGRVNLSPKGLDCFRVLDKNRVLWLSLTGSGNETSSHVQENGRMTIMFCAFEGKPLILRLYGTAKVVHPRDKEWEKLKLNFVKMAGMRQFFVMHVEMVQSSCGMGVPLYNFIEQRDMLPLYWEKRGSENVKKYWKERNEISIDGKPIKM